MLFSCKSPIQNTEQDAMESDLKEFLQEIDNIAFEFNEMDGYFFCNVNETQIVITLQDITYNNDIIHIHYTAHRNDYELCGFVNKHIINDNSGIMISFDDYYSTWDDTIDIFNNNNMRATWFVTGTLNEFCKRANQLGQCIGYHTKDHVMLKNLSEDKFNDYIDRFDWETISFLSEYRKNNISMLAFAIPHGNQLIYDWQKKRLYEQGQYKIIRDFDTKFHLYTKKEIQSGYISSQSIDNREFENDEIFKKKMTERLIIVKMTQKIYPCTSHTFSNDPSTGDGFSLTYNRLQILFNIINDLKIQTYTFNDFFE